MSKPRKIHLRNQCSRLRYKADKIRQLFHALDASGAFDAPEGEISVVFMGDEDIARLHGEFMGNPAPTDVITFPGDPEMGFAGEICVSADHAFCFARRKGLDFSRELSLYLVHGYLHLAGFDDLEPEKKRKMRRAEKKALSLVEKAGKLPEFILFDRSA